MATIPSVNVNKIAGTIAVASPNAGNPLFIGPSSNGTIGTIQTFGQANQVQTAGGYGTAVTAAMAYLATLGGTVNVIFASASYPGTVGAVASGSGVPALTVAGTPYDSYNAIVNVTTAGGIGTGAFQFSLDNGITPSSIRTIQGTFTIPNTGLTLTFPTASYTVGQAWSFSAYSPSMNAVDFSSACAPLTGSQLSPNMILVCNDTQTASQGSTLFTQANSICTTLTTVNQVPSTFIVPTGGPDSNNNSTIASQTVAAFASNAATLGNIISAVAERVVYNTPNAFEGYAFPEVPVAIPVIVAAGGVDVSTPIIWRQLGGLAGCTSATYDDRLSGNVYSPANIIAPCTAPRQAGSVYLNCESVLAAAGSPYTSLSQGRVMNLLDQVIANALFVWEGKSVTVNANGTLTKTIADAIDSQVNSAINTNILQPLTSEGYNGYVSSAVFAVNRSYNVLTTSQVQGSCNNIPLAVIHQITVNLGFAGG